MMAWHFRIFKKMNIAGKLRQAAFHFCRLPLDSAI
jgi:hypothetical protein